MRKLPVVRILPMEIVEDCQHLFPAFEEHSKSIMEQTFCEEGGANVIQNSSIHSCDSLPTLDGNSRAIVSTQYQA